MSLIEAVVLALIQGLTEFLPVSSSGHLILGSKLLAWSDQGLAFDVTVHLGSLLAVLIYFRKDVGALTVAFFASVFKREHSESSRLAWFVLIGTIPVGLAGLLFNDYIESELRSIATVAITMLIFAPFLWLADHFGSRTRGEFSLTWKDVGIIGLAQACALLPGVSRSGATMLAGLGLGLSREAAARFSFLLSIPVIVLVGGLKTVELVISKASVDWLALAVGFTVSALSAYLCIHLFLKFLERIGFKPFAFYLFALGCGLLMVY